MPDQRECDQINQRIDVLDRLIHAKTDELWLEHNNLNRLIKGDDIKGGMIGAINRFETVLTQIQISQANRARKEWGIISLVLAQFIYTIFKG